MTLRNPCRCRPLSVFVLAAVAALGLFGRPVGGFGGGQSRREADGARLLQKPFSASQLTHLVREMLDS